MKKTVSLLLIAFIITSCQSLQNLADNIRKPSLSVSSVRVTDFNFNEIELTYDVKVDNPNPVALQMLSYAYDLKINNNNFIKGDEDKKLRIESSGSSIIQIPMRLNFQELYNLFKGLKSKDEAPYRFAANLNFDLPVLGETTLPVKKSGNIPMIKLPKINLSSIKVNDINFTRAKLTLNLGVDNPNGFGLLVNALSYDLNVNGKNWIDGNNIKNMKIGENNSAQIAIPVSLNIAQIGTSVFQLINNASKLNYNFKGNFNFGAAHPLLESLKTKFSFDESGKVPLAH